MATKPVQLDVQFKARHYGGIYSVSGNLMIARIPGVDSRSRAVDGASEEQLARSLFDEILHDAERSGRLTA